MADSRLQQIRAQTRRRSRSQRTRRYSGRRRRPRFYIGVRRWQDGLSRLLGLSRTQRELIVTGMLRQHGTAVLAYWLKLMLSVAIATLGILNDSAALVLGAMLLSPLFSPVVGIAMGLVVRSPFLTMRSCVRVAASMVWGLAMAALMALILPMPEMTAQMTGRTVTGYTDLLLSTMCALVAALTMIRQQETKLVAEVAIGIVLVPTVSVSGFGLGKGNLSVFFGAAGFFIANLSTLLGVMFIVFACLGFRTNAARNEAREIVAVGNIASLAAVIRGLYGKSYGGVLRFITQLACYSAVVAGILSGLWHAGFQHAVQKVVTATLADRTVLKLDLSASRERVVLRTVVMGNADVAQETEDELRAKLRVLDPSLPFLRVQVIGLPDAATMSQVETEFLGQSLLREPAVATVVHSEPMSLTALQQRVQQHVVDAWPATAGELLNWHLQQSIDSPPGLVLVHTGPSLGMLAESLLIQLLRHEVVLIDRPITLGTWRVDGTRTLALWTPALHEALDAARQAPDLVVCVTRGPRRRGDPQVDTIEGLLQRNARANVHIVDGASWTVTVSQSACTSHEINGDTTSTSSRATSGPVGGLEPGP